VITRQIVCAHEITKADKADHDDQPNSNKNPQNVRRVHLRIDPKNLAPSVLCMATRRAHE
jgi:hypothetical protein